MTTSHSSSNHDHVQAKRTLPMRKCVVTGQIADKAHLIRFVVSPEGQLMADLGTRLGGRGVWVLANRDCVHKALSANRFSRYLKQTVKVADGFLSHLEQRLGDQVMARLSMMRKAGCLLTGGGKLRTQADVVGLLIADDASSREAHQLIGICQPDWTETGIPASWLGQISGSLSVAYAGVLRAKTPASGRLGALLKEDIARWRGVANVESRV